MAAQVRNDRGVRYRIFISLLSIACGPPPEGSCAGAPSELDIDDIEIVASVDPLMVIDDGDRVTYVVGFQGLPIATFDIGYHGSPTSCLQRSISVTDSSGAEVFGWTGGVSTRPTSDAAWRTEVVQVVEPPEGPITVAIDAYGHSMTRTVEPQPPASITAFEGPDTATVGAAFEVVLRFSAPSTRYQEIMVNVAQGGAMLTPTESYLAYGEDEVRVQVTPLTAGLLQLVAMPWPPDFVSSDPMTFAVDVL
jgi:hypothetical protein